MPLSERSQQAIVAALGRARMGRPVTTGDTRFWRQFGLPPWRQRAGILGRVADLIRGAAEFLIAGTGTILSSIFGERGGPAQTPTATLDIQVPFFDPRPTKSRPAGGITYRTYRVQHEWFSTVGDVLDDLASWKTLMARSYGLEELDADIERVMIY